MLNDLIQAGRWDEAIEHYTNKIRSKEAKYHDYANRAYLYLYKYNLVSGYADLTMAHKLINNVLAYAPDLGVVAWGLGRVDNIQAGYVD